MTTSLSVTVWGVMSSKEIIVSVVSRVTKQSKIAFYPLSGILTRELPLYLPAANWTSAGLQSIVFVGAEWNLLMK